MQKYKKELKSKKKDELFKEIISISYSIAQQHIEIDEIDEKCTDHIFNILIKNFKYCSKQTIIQKLCDGIGLENEVKEIFCVGSDSENDNDSDNDSGEDDIEDDENKDYIDQIFQISTKMAVDKFIFFKGGLSTHKYGKKKNEIKKELSNMINSIKHTQHKESKEEKNVLFVLGRI